MKQKATKIGTVFLDICAFRVFCLFVVNVIYFNRIQLSEWLFLT